jgi:hypothetical protein
VKLSNLKPFQEPPPPERQSCVSCKTFAPECLVPVGDDAVPMCWLCAHHVVEHEVSVADAHRADCKCSASEVFPNRVFAEGSVVVEEVPEEVTEKTLREIARERLLESDPARIIAWATEAHKQMSMSQHAAIQRRLKRKAS